MEKFSVLCVILTLLRVSCTVQQPCNFSISESSFSTPSFSELWGCFHAVPFDAPSANNTLRSLRAALQNYGYFDVVRNTGAPWYKHIDIASALNDIERTAYTSDYDFHDDLARLLNSLNDAHTTYTKPSCYSVDALQPIGIRPTVESDRLVLRAISLTFGGMDITSGSVPQEVIGREIVAIDGRSASVAINEFADTISFGDDIGSRFTYMAKSFAFSYRDGKSSTLPQKPYITYTVVSMSGEMLSFNASWMFFAQPSTNVTKFAASCKLSPQDSANCSSPSRRMEEEFPSRSPPRPKIPLHIRQLLAAGSADTRGRFLSAAHASGKYLQQQIHVDAKPRMNMEWTADLQQLLFRAELLPTLTATTTLISNQISDYGIYIVYDSSISAVRVRFSTFHPAALRNCFSGPSCPTPADEAAQSDCFDQHFDATIRHAISDAIDAFESEKASVLIFDLTGNTGGYVMLGQAMLLALSTALHRNPDVVAGTYDVRYSPLYDSALHFLAANPHVSDISPYLTSFFLPSTQQTVDRANTSWYSIGRATYQGAGTTRVSEPIALFDIASINGITAPRVTFDASNLVLVTDGLCGSMCAQFLKILHENGLARVVHMGGLPGIPGNTNSFAGGFVSDLADIARGMSTLGDAGWSAPEPIVAPFDTTARATFNFASRHSKATTVKYMQFDPLPAHLQTFSWGDTSSEAASELLLSAVAAVFSQQIRLPDGTFSAPVALKNSDQVEVYKAATAALAAILACIVVALLGVVIFRWAAGRRQKLLSSSPPAAPVPAAPASIASAV